MEKGRIEFDDPLFRKRATQGGEPFSDPRVADLKTENAALLATARRLKAALAGLVDAIDKGAFPGPTDRAMYNADTVLNDPAVRALVEVE